MVGQSAVEQVILAQGLSLSVFETAEGWVGMTGRGFVLHAFVLGYGSRNEVLARMREELESDVEIEDWNPDLRARLQSYFKGEAAGDFRDVETVVTEATPFAARVIAAVRDLNPGETRSYREIAVRAGSPDASRAVGNIMARNPIPVIIPCHRVVASGGRLGGYSSPRGLDLKIRLLELEGAPRFARQ